MGRLGLHPLLTASSLPDEDLWGFGTKRFAGFRDRGTHCASDDPQLAGTAAWVPRTTFSFWLEKTVEPIIQLSSW